ncbi:acyl carrier protein [Nocardia goodfellowii]|uniref:Acyl carrier protein n=1 Tax=Nocardia goodfellowii TaxID=882446 RepID=A0ABS4QKD6_9NOCA|nr:acyl carrier protein [Nocardia goodfellowii]MBP2191543.1 acyl carrier protein [Nocardia goodfellowii]
MTAKFTEIFDDLKSLLVEEAGVPVELVTPDALLTDLPGIDSLRMMRTVLRLENRTGIAVNESVVFGAKTLRDLVNGIEREIAAQVPDTDKK